MSDSSAPESLALISVGIVGPRGVGKTSLIAATMESGNEALIGTPVVLKAATRRAESRIEQFHNQLTGWIHAGELNASGVKPTSRVDELPFQLTIHDDDDLGVRFDVMDYAGGLITADEASEDRNRVKRHFAQSTVLIVPVDATYIMESFLPNDVSALPEAISLRTVHNIVTDWAKARGERPDEPAILVIAPLKCESYLSDNGGRIDESAKLKSLVMRQFDDSVERARAEIGDGEFEAWYCPIDTIGCIEKETAHWLVDSTGRHLVVDYVIRPPAKHSPKGTRTLLHLIANHIVKAQRRLTDEESTAAWQKAEKDAKRAGQDRGFWGNIYWSITRTRRRLRETANMAKADAEAKERRAQAVGDALSKLAHLPSEGRLSRLA